MSIIYSTTWDLGGWGLSNITHQQAIALYDANLLEMVLCYRNNQHIIPKRYIREPTSMEERLKMIRSSFIGSGETDPSFLGWQSSVEQKYLKLIENYNGKILKYCGSTYPTVQHDIMVYQEIYHAQRFGILPNRTNHESLRSQVMECEDLDSISCASDFVRKSFLAAGISDKKMSVLPLGVDTDVFFPHNKEKSSGLRIGFSATNSIRKGLFYLLEAYRGFEFERSLNVRANVAVEMKGLRNYGYLDDMKVLYNDSDVFILPSAEDGFGMTVLESMACGTPVMTTKTTGASEIITHGVDGFVYDTPEQCCKALAEINEMKDQLPEIGARAQETAEKYTWEVYRKKFAKWAEKTINL